MCETEQKRIRELEDRLEKALKTIEELKKRLRVAEGAEAREKLRLFKPRVRRRHKRPGPPEDHPGVSRESPEPDETVELGLAECPAEGCREPLSGPVDLHDHFVTELIPARLKTTRYVVPRYRCPVHGLVSPPVPDGLPHARFGIGLMAWVAFHRVLGVPYRKIQRLLRHLCGLRLSRAALIAMVERVARELKPIYHRLKEEIRCAEAVYADETRWKVEGKDRSLWAFVSEMVTLYGVEKGKGGKVIRKYLGKSWDGTLGVDGYPGFDSLEFRKQRCHLHLLRELDDVLHRRSGASLRFRRFAKKVRRLFHDSERCAERVADPGERARWKTHYEARLDRFLDRRFTDPDEFRISKTLRKYRNEWFVFLVEDVEPNTNPAEGAIKPWAVNRYVSHGSRSKRGAASAAVVMSVAETCRKGGLEFLQVARRAMAAAATGSS